MSKNNPLIEEKLKKRQKLLDQGINPYPHDFWQKRKNSQQIKELFIKSSKSQSTPPPIQGTQNLNHQKSTIVETKNSNTEKVELTNNPYFMAGRLMRKRPMGKAAFFNIQDSEGELQCYIRKDTFYDKQKPEQQSLNAWYLWQLCDIGDIIALKGTLFKTKKGEPSLKVQDLKMLCKSIEPLPEKYHGLEDKELKYRYRHLDLIMDPKSREIFKIRSQVIHEIRNFLQKKGFLEVETPVLQALYGGALAEPFETHFRRLNQKMYLKISPEIYLKKLIVGGFEKVFEIGKNFRNEGIDRTHNPEFTMLEYYQAYTDYQDQMLLFEKLVGSVVESVNKSKLKNNLLLQELNNTNPIEEQAGTLNNKTGEFNQGEEKAGHKDSPKNRKSNKTHRGQQSEIGDSQTNLKDEIGLLKFDYLGKELDLNSPWTCIPLKDFEALMGIALDEGARDKQARDGQAREERKRGFENKYREEFPALRLAYGGQFLEPEEFWKNLKSDLKKWKLNPPNFNFTKENLAQKRNPRFKKISKRKNSKRNFSDFWEQAQSKASINLQTSSNQVEANKAGDSSNTDSFTQAKPRGDESLHQLQKQFTGNKAESWNNSEDITSLFNTIKKFLPYAQFLDPKANWEKFKILLKVKNPAPQQELEELKNELVLKTLELTVEKYFWDPVFIIDFPLSLSPLTKKHRKFPKLVERFEPYIAGMEIGNAYTELNDPIDQRQRLSQQKRQSSNKDENKHPLDENFLHALEVGMPPTGGVGLGIERLVMILSNQKSIRDCILFPTLRSKEEQKNS